MQAGKKSLRTFGIKPCASIPKLGLVQRRSLSTKHPKREDKHAQTGPIWRRPFQKLVPGATFNTNIMTKTCTHKAIFCLGLQTRLPISSCDYQSWNQPLFLLQSPVQIHISSEYFRYRLISK